MLPAFAVFLETSIVHASPLPVAVSPESARFVRDLRAKNIDDAVSLYTADAVFIDPSGRYVGRRRIHALYERVAATFDSDLTLLPNVADHRGSVDVEAGTWREHLRDRKTGVVQSFRGTYRFTLVRQPDGRRLFSGMQWTLAAAPPPR